MIYLLQYSHPQDLFYKTLRVAQRVCQSTPAIHREDKTLSFCLSQTTQNRSVRKDTAFHHRTPLAFPSSYSGIEHPTP